jgi:hypothetical protein
MLGSLLGIARGLAEMGGDRRDVKLIDGDSSARGLVAPVGRSASRKIAWSSAPEIPKERD